MNQSSKIGLAVLAAAMIATPVAAQQAKGSSAAKLSVSAAAAAAPAEGQDGESGYYQARRGLFGSGGSGLFIGLGAIAAIIAAIVIAADQDDENDAVSP